MYACGAVCDLASAQAVTDGSEAKICPGLQKGLACLMYQHTLLKYLPYFTEMMDYEHEAIEHWYSLYVLLMKSNEYRNSEL